MAIIEVETKGSGGNKGLLPLVRRIEAVSFRACPAEDSRYDGSWLTRFSPSLKAVRRVNCVIPLDPEDQQDVGVRLRRLRALYDCQNLRFRLKQTPLCSPAVIDWLTKNQFQKETESIVMMNALEHDLPKQSALTHLPANNLARFSDYCAHFEPRAHIDASNLSTHFSLIKPEKGFFFLPNPEKASAIALCVRDQELAGIQSLAVCGEKRQQGLGTAILASALHWAYAKGSKMGWLQVEANNQAALNLYRRFRFKEVYRYSYWTAPNEESHNG